MTLSRQERKAPTKALYQILRKLHQQIGGQFEDLFVEAQGTPMTGAIHPYSNIKNGDYDRVKTRNIHEWLARNYFAFAQGEAPHLFQYRRQSDWDLFIETHLVEGDIEVIPFASFGISRQKPPEDGIATFRLGQQFTFRLDTPRLGYVVAFEGIGDTWHPLALNEAETDNRLKLTSIPAYLPQTKSGAPIGIAEHDDTGPHMFVFVHCLGPRPLRDQKSLITYAEDHEVEVYKANVRIVG